jgi:hypothetical protein
MGSKATRPICVSARIFAEGANTQMTYNHVIATTWSAVIDSNAIMSNILVICGRRMLLDSDLAALYRVETRALTRAVRRNAQRFPGDFMFPLAAEGSDSLRSQFGALKTGRGKHRKYAPYVFTEQGVAGPGSRRLRSELVLRIFRNLHSELRARYVGHPCIGRNIPAYLGTDQSRTFKLNGKTLTISEAYIADGQHVRAERMLRRDT